MMRVSLWFLILVMYVHIHAGCVCACMCLVLVRLYMKGRCYYQLLIVFFLFISLNHIRLMPNMIQLLEQNALRSWMIHRAMETDQSGAMSALLFADSRHWMSEYRILLSKVGLMHVWVISGYHLYYLDKAFSEVSKRYKRADKVLKIALIAYIWVVCAASIPLMRAWLSRHLRHLSHWDRMQSVWIILLFLYPHKSLHPSMILSLWMSMCLALHHGRKDSGSDLKFSMYAWVMMLYPCVTYGIDVNPWGWLMDHMWSRYVVRLMMPAMWCVWALGPGRVSELWAVCLARYLGALEFSQSLFPYKLISTFDSGYLLLGLIITLMFYRDKIQYICIFWCLWSYLPQKSEHYLHMFDVGRGSCILWVSGHHAVLLDATEGRHARKVAAYLQRHHIALDAILISHHDKDHMGGLAILRGYLKDSRQVWMPSGSKASPFFIKNRVYKHHICRRGDVIHMGESQWSVVHPDDHHYGGNDQSCVWRLSGPESWLFPGDISSKVELKLIKEGLQGPLDGLISSHHGSRSSNHRDWIKALNPKIIWISTHANSWKKKRVIIERFKSADRFQRYDVSSDGDVHITLRSEQKFFPEARSSQGEWTLE